MAHKPFTTADTNLHKHVKRLTPIVSAVITYYYWCFMILFVFIFSAPNNTACFFVILYNISYNTNYVNVCMYVNIGNMVRPTYSQRRH